MARRVVLFGICVYAIRAFTSGPGHLAVRLTYRAVARTGARDLLRFKAITRGQGGCRCRVVPPPMPGGSPRPRPRCRTHEAAKTFRRVGDGPTSNPCLDHNHRGHRFTCLGWGRPSGR